MRGHMTITRTKATLALAAFALLVACGNGALLPVTQLFGATMTMAFAQDATDAPLGSAVIARLSNERSLSLITDPIDL